MPSAPGVSRKTWAFPRHRPQLFSASPRALAVATRYYAFGRQVPRWQRRLVERAVAVPVVRRLVTNRRGFAPPCGWGLWPSLAAAAGIEGEVDWAFFVSTWQADRFGAYPVRKDGAVPCFVHARPAGRPDVRPRAAGSAFRIPQVLRTAAVADWLVGVVEPLPPMLRAPGLDHARLAAVSAGVTDTLDGAGAPPGGTPTEWRPIHGDLTPWNLREDDQGGLWLMDWEAAGWGPPGADALHYRLAEASLTHTDPAELAGRVRASLGEVDPAVAAFWLDHAAFSAPPPEDVAGRGRRADVARRELVREALRLLAGG